MEPSEIRLFLLVGAILTLDWCLDSLRIYGHVCFISYIAFFAKGIIINMGRPQRYYPVSEEKCHVFRYLYNIYIRVWTSHYIYNNTLYI